MVKVRKVYPLYSHFERCVEYKKSRRISMSIIGSLFLLLIILNIIAISNNIQETAKAKYIQEDVKVTPEIEKRSKRKLIADFSEFVIYDGYIEKEVPKEVKKIVKQMKVTKKQTAALITNNTKSVVAGSESSNTDEIKSKAAAEIVSLMERYKKYPKQAKRINAEGVANITFSISSQGVVSNVVVSKTSGYSILDQAALEAAKKIVGFNAVKDNSYDKLLKITVPVDFYLD